MQQPPQPPLPQMMMMQQQQQQQQTSITTDQIQKYLDDNKKLILAILDNQNLGKLAECAQYQAVLQKNLMFLAAIADAQPQAPAIPSQMTAPPHPAMQQGGFYMQQHPQAAMAQQAGGGLFPQHKGIPLQQQQQQQSPQQFFSNQQHQLQEQQQQQQQQQQQFLNQQAMQGQLGIRPGSTNNGMQTSSSHAEATKDASRGGDDDAGDSSYKKAGDEANNK